MKKKKFFAPLLGALVLGLSAYAGYRTYDAYNGVSESDLLLENAEALASDDEGSDCHYSNGYRSWNSSGRPWEKEKEFYDCCAELRHGYNPSGNCV